MKKERRKEQEDKKKGKEIGGHKGHGYYIHYYKAKLRRKRLNPFSTCIVRSATHDYQCIQQSRMKNKIVLENLLYCSVSEFICRGEEINGESQHKIRFRVRERHIKKASCRRRKLSLSGKIYSPERKIIQESQALTLYFVSLRR